MTGQTTGAGCTAGRSSGWRLAIVAAAALALAAPALAADDNSQRAMKLFEKRHYDEAAAAFRGELASTDPAKQGPANLALGMVYLRNGMLHRELFHAASLVEQDYLKKLSAAQGRDRSRFVDLYLGEALLASGKPGVAAIYLEKFANTDGLEPKYRMIALAGLGLCQHQNGEAQKALDLWASIDAADPEVRTELAAVYSTAGLADKDPAGLLEESLATLRKTEKTLPQRAVKNALAVYARLGKSEKGLDLLKRADLRSYSYRETIGRSKVITFYDLSLLNDLATLYLQAGVAALEKASGDGKTKGAADFHLAQAHALLGAVEQSSRIAAAVITNAGVPPQVKDRMRAWQAANLHLRNRQAEAAALWDELARRQPADPDLLAEVLAACSRVRTDCAQPAQKAAQAVETGDARRYAAVAAALGRYHLARLDVTRALTSLEAGRDKGNKNKIEANDPVMLVDLADAYYRTKKYSEALEIYFEMSKQFPEVRQLQEALQGVYAVDHKSAGDVKIN